MEERIKFLMHLHQGNESAEVLDTIEDLCEGVRVSKQWRGLGIAFCSADISTYQALFGVGLVQDSKALNMGELSGVGQYWKHDGTPTIPDYLIPYVRKVGPDREIHC